jgi:hypothetical protein
VAHARVNDPLRQRGEGKCEVHLVAIPDSWRPPQEGIFIKETMENLADLGEKMGKDPASWMPEVP